MKYLAIRLTLVMLLAAVFGCGTGPAGKARFGTPIAADMAVNTAKQINDNPQSFEGKDVLVQGKITSECPSGGWVWVNDGTGDIYVNMHPTNVFIPQKVGKTVRAMGKVVLVEGRPQVYGSGLEFP